MITLALRLSRLNYNYARSLWLHLYDDHACSLLSWSNDDSALPTLMPHLNDNNACSIELRVRPGEDIFSIGPLKRFDCWSLVRGEALCSGAPSRWTTPGLCVGCNKELLRLAALWRRLMRMFWWTLYLLRFLLRLECCAKEKLQVTQNITVTWLFLEPSSQTTLFCVGPKIKSN